MIKTNWKSHSDIIQIFFSRNIESIYSRIINQAGITLRWPFLRVNPVNRHAPRFPVAVNIRHAPHYMYGREYQARTTPLSGRVLPHPRCTQG